MFMDIESATQGCWQQLKPSRYHAMHHLPQPKQMMQQASVDDMRTNEQQVTAGQTWTEDNTQIPVYERRY